MNEKLKFFLDNCKKCPFNDRCSRLKILKDAFTKDGGSGLSELWLDCNPCVYCGFWDSDREGCECPTLERYLCPLEESGPEDFYDVSSEERDGF